MLSPSVDVVSALLTEAYNETLRLDSYSLATGNTRIGVLPQDPDWLPPVRDQVAMLATAGAAWTRDKPGIWGSVLLQFTDYASAFSGVAAMYQQGSLTTAEQWTEVLGQVLVPALNSAATATDTAEASLRSHLDAFSAVQPSLEQSIDNGWTDLGDEEEQMTAIATQLGQLQQLVASLAESVTSEQISTGQEVVTTTVEMLYNIATDAAESFSFLSMAASVFTVGKAYYELITDTDEATDALQEIAKLQVEASEAAQAAAGTKMVLQLLYDLIQSFGSIIDVMPQISTMWRNELAKVQSVVEALNAGVDPATYLELFTVPAANAGWQSIDDFALRIPQLKTSTGQPVVLDPQNPLSPTVSSLKGTS